MWFAKALCWLTDEQVYAMLLHLELRNTVQKETAGVLSPILLLRNKAHFAARLSWHHKDRLKELKW